jgi:cellobiose dehydrogenase (acceptor)
MGKFHVPFQVLLGFFTILGTVLSSPLAFKVHSDEAESQKYDAIVVGAGPAGIIVATRLAQAGLSTLLLEAGGPSYRVTGNTQAPQWLNGTGLSRVDVPGLYNSVFSVKADPALVCPDQWMHTYAGCALGGSTAINAGLFFEPPASDWNDFFPDGWKASNVSGAVERLKQMQPSSKITSMDGKMYAQSSYEVARAWIVQGAGYNEVEINDQNDDKTEVFGHTIFDYSGGQRGGPVTNYLQEALKLPNFHLETGARVHHVVQYNGTAVAVAVLSSNDTGTTTTLRQLSDPGRVILSTGAVVSPQILMYSGIGNTATLQRLAAGGVLSTSSDTWVANPAVGEGLFDNPNTFIVLRSQDIEAYTFSYDDPIPDHASMYIHNRSGPYTFAGQTAVWWTYIDANESTTTKRHGVQGTVATAGFGAYATQSDMTVNIYGTSGLGSRGRVELDENFIPGPSGDVLYSDARDAKSIASFIRALFNALPATLEPMNIPRNASVDDIETYITTPSDYARGYVNHWSSSCAIGPCVDLNAQVVGTSNVHVVDASILQPLTVNPQMGVMIAAEHATERILSLYHV